MKQEYKEQAVKGVHIPLSGMIAGLIATIPMTIFMLMIHRLLPKWQRYTLPPEEVTKELAERTDTKKYLDKPLLVGSSIVSHFGYGAASGALYTTLTRQISLAPALKGSLFGLLIWAGSYLGWMPLANIKVAAIREPVQRNSMMIISHIIWGSVTGLVADRLEQQRQ